MNVIENKLVKETIMSLVQSGEQIICIYHPMCRDNTLKWILCGNISFPNQSTNEYIINGIDLTDILESVNLVHLSSVKNSLLKKIEDTTQYIYRFSKDYSYELIYLK